VKLLFANRLLDVHLPPGVHLEQVSDHVYKLSDSESLAAIVRDGVSVWVSEKGRTFRFDPAFAAAEESDKLLRAPMTAKVVKLAVSKGDQLNKGDLVAILEAMKMEYRLEAQTDGVVIEIGCQVGDLVDLGQTIARLSPIKTEDP
jgi:biotin carboxyl carrier protein